MNVKKRKCRHHQCGRQASCNYTGMAPHSLWSQYDTCQGPMLEQCKAYVALCPRRLSMLAWAFQPLNVVVCRSSACILS